MTTKAAAAVLLPKELRLLTSVFCTLKPRVELHENDPEFHEVS
jgi:hypothetical protein